MHACMNITAHTCSSIIDNFFCVCSQHLFSVGFKLSENFGCLFLQHHRGYMQGKDYNNNTIVHTCNPPNEIFVKNTFSKQGW